MRAFGVLICFGLLATTVTAQSTPTAAPNTLIFLPTFNNSTTPTDCDVFGVGCIKTGAPASSPTLVPTSAIIAPPTPAPTRAPWSCSALALEGLEEYGFACTEMLSKGDPLEYTAAVTYICRTDEFVEPPFPSTRNGECLSFCLLQTLFGSPCFGCALLESGEIAYDCRNLNGAEEWDCPARDGDSNCRGLEEDDDYTFWACVPNILGDGSFCTSINPGLSFDNVLNPAFDEAEATGSFVIVYCHDDISGFDLEDCKQPYCRIVDEDLSGIDGICDSCQVTEDSEFAYDCSNTDFNLTCPIRKADGTCSTPSYQNATASAWPRDNTSFSSVNQEQGVESEEWVWTIDISPTAFNVVSDIFAKLSELLIAAAIVSLYAFMLSLQSRSDRHIPIEDLTQIPGDSVDALKLLARWRLSLPAMLLVVLLLVADFSHTVADIGLNFVDKAQRGPNATVLVVSSDRRNPQRALQMAGDPTTVRSDIFSTTTNPDASRREDDALRSFLEAIKDIAEGFSGLVTDDPKGDYVRAKLPYGDVPGFISFFEANDGALFKLENEIPLNCSSSVPMAQFNQYSEGLPPFDELLENTASIPNCTFSEMRSSGIYSGSTGSSEIVEEASFVAIHELVERGEDIGLRGGNETFQSFEVSPASKRLARDRKDWKEGRVISEVDGIVIGNLTIDFGRVVVASGSEVGITDTDEDRRSYNGLVAEIDGDCPFRPSGHPSANTSCVAIMVLLCDTFHEDFIQSQHEFYAPQDETSECSILAVGLVWGRNFKADAELVSVLAGIYGFVRPTFTGGGMEQFFRRGALAALFALGTIDERRSIENVIRPQINIVYIIFMALPVVLALGLFVAARVTINRLRPIPKNAWELMILAKDEPMIPHRRIRQDSSPFPPPDDDLVYVFHDAHESLPDEPQPPEPCIVRRSVLAKARPSPNNATEKANGRPLGEFCDTSRFEDDHSKGSMSV